MPDVEIHLENAHKLFGQTKPPHSAGKKRAIAMHKLSQLKLPRLQTH